MFESAEVRDRCTGVELATLIEDNHRDLVRHENRALALAAAWADLYDADPAEPYAPLIHRMRAVGGDGTPEVSEYAAAEFGALQGVGMFSGWEHDRCRPGPAAPVPADLDPGPSRAGEGVAGVSGR